MKINDLLSGGAFLLRHQGRRSSKAGVSRIQNLALERCLELASSSAGLLNQVSLKGVVVTLMLLGILLFSAFGVVYSSHLSRQLFAEQAVLIEKNDQLQLEWAQLLLEQSAWSAPNRIEAIASHELQMVMPEVEQIEVVY